MKHLTYRAYLEDIAVRQALDREVERLRQEAIDQFIVAPVRGLLRRAFGHRVRARRPLVAGRDLGA